MWILPIYAIDKTSGLKPGPELEQKKDKRIKGLKVTVLIKLQRNVQEGDNP